MTTIARTPDNVEPRNQIIVRAALAFLAAYWAQAVTGPLAQVVVKAKVGSTNRRDLTLAHAQHLVLELVDDLCNLGLPTPACVGPGFDERTADVIRSASAARFEMTPAQRREFDRCLADFSTAMHGLGVRVEVAR